MTVATRATTVRFAVLPATGIFNLASPRYLPEVFRAWAGKLPWHSEKYEPLRDAIEDLYVGEFDRISGHYERLTESIRAEGFRNPIMVSAGRLDGHFRRTPEELPPKIDPDTAIVCEYLGGSRLWVAQNMLGLGAAIAPSVPCIVNDHANVLRNAEVLTGLPDVLRKFTDKPRSARFSEAGVYVNDLPYMHLPEAERYSTNEQSKIRRGILKKVHHLVQEWLRAHD